MHGEMTYVRPYSQIVMSFTREKSTTRNSSNEYYNNSPN